MDDLGVVNSRYEPWGGNPSGKGSSPAKYELAVKDPLVTKSADWNFPTNKLPNVGWLGRVHRGTPWQTVYMKARNIPNWKTWREWTGNSTTNVAARRYDAWLTTPTNDYALFDLFTATPNQNAARGQLSINQENLAAWSAVLSGVVVLTNTTPNPGVFTQPRYEPLVIPPAGVYDPNQPTPVARIVQGINRARANTNSTIGPVFTGRVFHSVGDILSVPELTVGVANKVSPFLNATGNAAGPKAKGAGQLTVRQMYDLSEEAYERIPQQIMGLLTLDRSPRFVVYAYGQTLQPAERSVVLASGAFNKLCTNYQVTAEVATRAVVRVEGTPDIRYTRNNPDPSGNFYPPRLVVEQFNVLPPD